MIFFLCSFGLFVFRQIFTIQKLRYYRFFLFFWYIQISNISQKVGRMVIDVMNYHSFKGDYKFISSWVELLEVVKWFSGMSSFLACLSIGNGYFPFVSSLLVAEVGFPVHEFALKSGSWLWCCIFCILTYSSNLYILPHLDRKSFAYPRKALMSFKYVSVLQVKQLEDGVVKLVKASDECTHLSSALQSIGKEYQPTAEVSSFLGSFLWVLALILF